MSNATKIPVAIQELKTKIRCGTCSGLSRDKLVNNATCDQQGILATSRKNIQHHSAVSARRVSKRRTESHFEDGKLRRTVPTVQLFTVLQSMYDKTVHSTPDSCPLQLCLELQFWCILLHFHFSANLSIRDTMQNTKKVK